MNLSKEELDYMYGEMLCNDEDVNEENNEAFDKFDDWLSEFLLLIERRKQWRKEYLENFRESHLKIFEDNLLSRKNIKEINYGKI